MEAEAFQQALSALVDDDLTPEVFAELQEYLRDSAEAREDYRDWMALQTLIQLELSVPQSFETTLSTEKVVSIQRRKQVKQALLVSAALMILTALVLSVIAARPSKKFASISVTPGTNYEVIRYEKTKQSESSEEVPEGSRVLLRQGFMEFTLCNKVRAIVRGPAEFQLSSENLVDLKTGTAWFDVPRKAIGFQVKTPELLLTDLGTSFGIKSSSEIYDEVHVFEGKVSLLKNFPRGEEIFLEQNQAVVTAPGKGFRETPFQRKDFHQTLPKSLEYIHWSFDQIEGDAFLPKAATLHKKGNGHALFLNQKGSLEDYHVDGRFGKAFSLDAGGRNALVTDFPGIAGSCPRTVAFWVRAGSEPKGTAGLIVWGQSDLAYGAEHDTRRDQLRWKINLVSSFFDEQAGRIQLIGTGHLTGTKNLCDGKWHHVVCTYRESDAQEPVVECYIDGEREELQPRGPQKIAQTLLSTESRQAIPVSFGFAVSNPVASRSEIDIDEVYIFSSVLSRESIQRLRNQNRFTD